MKISNKVINQYEKLPRSFYTRNDVVKIARELVGKYIFSRIEGTITGGRIVETEAYNGRMDRACHAFHKRTPRTEIMYAEGGKAYVYLCYGIHHLFNIVTNEEGLADAVLIRAVEPTLGLETIMKRRGKDSLKRITAGPGTVGEGLGIRVGHTGEDLTSNMIWVASPERSEDFDVDADRRIGVDYAGDDADLPWRFFIKGNSFVSKQKTKPRSKTRVTKNS